jgi:hypothetical protein
MERIADRLSQMRGAAMKLGQLMSMETGDCCRRSWPRSSRGCATRRT